MCNCLFFKSSTTQNDEEKSGTIKDSSTDEYEDEEMPIPWNKRPWGETGRMWGEFGRPWGQIKRPWGQYPFGWGDAS